VTDSQPTVIDLTFTEGQSERLDKFLAARMPEFSRSRIQDLIKNGSVTVNGVLPRKTGQILETNASVRILLPPVKPGGIIPEAIALDIIYEDSNLMALNKPAGMVVHPSAGHLSGTLVHAALAHAPEMDGIGGELRPGVVHRLDKNTSGLIMLAKNDRTYIWLQDQFRRREISKVYLALVDGQPPTPAGRIEAPIGRDPRTRRKMAIVPSELGRQAVSEYRTLETFPNYTVLEIHPITGRTHQIRLHLAFINCPVAGDTIYGRKRSTIPVHRHFLHAWRLTLRLPGQSDPITFEAPLPPDLERILQSLRRA